MTIISHSHPYLTRIRQYTMELLDGGYIDKEQFILAVLGYFDGDTLRGLLDANEWSPRFLDPNEDDTENDV